MQQSFAGASTGQDGDRRASDRRYDVNSQAGKMIVCFATIALRKLRLAKPSVHRGQRLLR